MIDLSNIRYAEFCAGIGGFRLGIENTEWNSTCVYANDIELKCENTYHLNFNCYFNSHDIFEINPIDLPEFDILCSGFPCQPFSQAGLQRGFDDDRGLVFFKLIDIIRIKRPSVVFLENVPNLRNHDNGNTYKTIIEQLQSLRYSVFSDILDSAEFGVPQSRPRIYMVCFNNDEYPNINFQFPQTNNMHMTLRQILNNGDYSITITKKWNTYIDLYTGRISLKDIDFDVPKTRKHLEKTSNNCDLNDCIFQIRSSGIRAYSLDRPYPTFAVSNSGGGAMIPVLSRERRHMNLIEIKRLMSFPDTFRFGVSRTDSIKQLANAVCPSVITNVYNRILYTIDNY